MRRAIRPLGGMPARESRLQTGLGVHRSCRPAPVYRCRVDPAATQCGLAASMWLNGMAESRRKTGRLVDIVKCCRTVANQAQVLPRDRTRISYRRRVRRLLQFARLEKEPRARGTPRVVDASRHRGLPRSLCSAASPPDRKASRARCLEVCSAPCPVVEPFVISARLQSA
jgi:hypothetical protein